MKLTMRLIREYDPRRLEKDKHGFSSPDERGAQRRTCHGFAAFLCAAHARAPVFGRAVWEGFGPAGFLVPGLLTHTVPPTSFSSGEAVLQSLNKEPVMAHTAQGASAPAIPSVFSTREDRVIKRALGLIESKILKQAPVLEHFEDFERYLMLRFAGLTNEEGHVLYLNINHQLLAAETEFYGHQKSVQWDIRKVVLRAITLGAEHVVFAHNHPNENPIPSEGDLRHAEWSIAALSTVSINLLDSYVVTAQGITSVLAYKQERDDRQRREYYEFRERRSAERRAKMAATRARKAAEKAAQLQGASA